MYNKRSSVLITGTVILACVIMALVDALWQPVYAVKSVIKIVLFLALPVVYTSTDNRIKLKTLFKVNKNGFKTALILGIAVYALILGGYFLLKDVFL